MSNPPRIQGGSTATAVACDPMFSGRATNHHQVIVVPDPFSDLEMPEEFHEYIPNSPTYEVDEEMFEEVKLGKRAATSHDESHL